MGGSSDRADTNRNVRWVFGRRIVWSPWWWFAVVGIVLALVLVVAWPVLDSGGSGTTDCGTLVAPDARYVDNEGEVTEFDGSDTCESMHGARWHRVLSVLAISVLPMWLGSRDNRRGDVNAAHVAATVCVGVSLALLLGPQTSSDGYECGSPLLRGQETILELEGDTGLEQCGRDRSGRVGWAALWGVAAVPFAMGAGRGRDD